MCCTPHLTSFAVGEPIEVSYGRYAKTIATLVTLNVFYLFFTILGVCLDRMKLYIFDDKPLTLPTNNGAAELEQESTVVNGQKEESKVPDESVNEEKKVDAMDIKINLEEPKGNESSASKKESDKEEDPVPDVYEKPMSFCHYYRNAFRYYNRIGSMIYSSNIRSKRAIKVLNSFTQISMAIAIVCLVISFDGHGERPTNIAIASTFFLMRFI